MANIKIILSTIDEGSVARSMARRLVEERLAACVNLVARVASIYRWQDEVQEEQEVLLVIKTVAEKVDPLQRRLLQLHPYEVPEFIVLDVEEGSEAYFEWLAGQTTG